MESFKYVVAQWCETIVWGGTVESGDRHVVLPAFYNPSRSMPAVVAYERYFIAIGNRGHDVVRDRICIVYATATAWLFRYKTRCVASLRNGGCKYDSRKKKPLHFFMPKAFVIL